MLESLIDHDGSSRSRKRISRELGISGSALSQYIRQQNWPSFLKLLAIADFFDVSLDYLVYGQPGSTAIPDPGPLYRYLDHALAQAQARGSRHTAVVTRIGRVLTDRIDAAAKELAATPAAAREGLIQDDELLRLERYCLRCDLLNLKFDFNLIRVPGGSAPGRFLSVVAANLGGGTPYRFLLAQGESWSEIIGDFRQLLSDQIGGDRVRENCAFRVTAAPVTSGILLYQLDTSRLEVEEPALHAQISDYLYNNVWLGCVSRTNSESNFDMIMDPDHVRRALEAFAQLWSSSLPL